jgi:NTE family protein
MVLSGGGARGVAHVGVLRALREAGIRPKAFSGTSAGAMVAALVADGHDLDDILPMIQEAVGPRQFWKMPFSVHKRLGNFLEKNLRHQRIEDLPIPFHIAVTDLEKGGQILLDSGELVPALLAASAIPAIFPPVVINGVHCVDGGLSNNLPVAPFAEQKAQVIAVHVNPIAPYDKRSTGLLSTMERAFHLSFLGMVQRSAEGCQLFIEPPELGRFGLFDLGDLEEMERIGHEYTRKLLAGRQVR